jgi:hypothetical protein
VGIVRECGFRLACLSQLGVLGPGQEASLNQKERLIFRDKGGPVGPLRLVPPLLSLEVGFYKDLNFSSQLPEGILYIQ